MVHKKYIIKGGKKYGPYLYESYRDEQGRVKKRYIHGPSLTNYFFSKHSRVILFGVVFIVLLGAFLFGYSSFSKPEIEGKVSAEIEPVYRIGEPLSGEVRFNIREGELIPQNSKVTLVSGERSKDLFLSDVSIKAELLTGNFYAENSQISGYGDGFGVYGKKVSTPELNFQLLVSTKKEEKGEEQEVSVPAPEKEEKEAEEKEKKQEESETETNESVSAETPTEEKGEEVSAPASEEKEKEEKSEGEKTESQSAEGEQTTIETAGEGESESPVSEASETGEATGVTGNIVIESAYTLNGRVKKGEDFSYQLESGQTAELISGSINIDNGTALDDGVVKLTIDENGKVQVATEYELVEQGFGEDFLGEYKLALKLDLAAFDMKVSSPELQILLTAGDDLIASASKNVLIEAGRNETPNETFVEEIPESKKNISISQLQDILSIRVPFGGEELILLSNYFEGADSYKLMADNLTGIVSNNAMTITADNGFKGVVKASIVAKKGKELLESNEFNVLVSSGAVSIVTSRQKIKVGEKVKWLKNVTLETPETLRIEIPAEAENVSVKEIDETGKEKLVSSGITGQVTIDISLKKQPFFVLWLKKLFRSITGRAIVEQNSTLSEQPISVELNATATQYVIEYYTDAPVATESDTKNGKEVVVSGPDTLVYENVIASSNLENIVPVEKQGMIKVYWHNYDAAQTIGTGQIGQTTPLIKEVEQVEEIEIVEEETINSGTSFSPAVEMPAVEQDAGISIESADNTNKSNETGISFGESVVANESSSSDISISAITGSSVPVTGNAILKGNNESNVSANSQQLTQNGYIKQEIPFDAYDTDFDGKIDYIEWVVPHLSNQTFEIIYITKAEHLDGNRAIIEDIYELVKARDGNWTNGIPATHYVRATFEKNLTNKNDITIYVRSNASGNIKVYEKDSDIEVADFGIINEDKKYQILLTELPENYSQDTFDLKVLNGAIEFDYIVDPYTDTGAATQNVNDCGNLTTANAVYTLTKNVNSSATCFFIKANNITLDGAGYTINYSYAGTLGYGINITLVNFTTIKNARIVEGVSTTNTKIGVLVYTSYNTTIINNTIITIGTASAGIQMQSGASNNSAYNNNISVKGTGTTYGIRSTGSNDNIIAHNFINMTGASNTIGISIDGSGSRNNVDNNTISAIASTTGASAGIVIGGSFGLVINNSVEVWGLNFYGISVGSVTGTNNLSGNSVNSSQGLSYLVEGTNGPQMNHNIDNTNTADGKPVNFTYDADNLVFDGVNFAQYGQTIFTYSRNITIKNSNFSLDGLAFYWVNQSTIFNNHFNTSTSAITLTRNPIHNNITGNNINASYTNGHGIQFPSANPGTGNDNVLIGNNINVSGASSHGIFISSIDRNNITGNTITTGSTASHALYLSSTDNNIVNNNSLMITTSTSSSSFGLALCISSFNSIANTTIWSSGQSLSFNTISGCSTSITGNNLTRINATMFNSGTTNGAIDVGSQAQANFTLTDSYINSSSTREMTIQIRTPYTGTFNFTNVSAPNGDKLRVTFASNGVNATLDYGWWLDINVSDNSTNSSLEGANATTWDADNIMKTNNYSDVNGRIRVSLSEYIQNRTDTKYFSFYTLNVTNNSYQNFTNSTINMTTNQWVNAKLQPITASDTTSPLVTINLPANITYNSLPIRFNVTLNEDTNYCNYTLNAGVKNYTMQNNGNRDFNATNSSIADGSYTARYYCWDTSNNLNGTETRTFSIDTIAPTITINSPTGNLSVSQVTFNITTNENSETAQFSLNGGVTNMTMQNNGNTNFNYTNTSIADGTYTANFYVNDTAGNFNRSVSTIFTIDTIKPLVTINQPQTYVNSLPVLFNVTTNENVNYCNYTLNAGAKNYTMTANASNNGFNATNGSIADGSYTARYYCWDTSNNLNGTETKAFTIDTIAPVVTINQPLANTTSSSVAFNITTNEDIDSAFVSIDGGVTNKSMQNNGNRDFNFTNTSVLDNRYTVRFYVNDTAGNWNRTATKELTVDTTAPKSFLQAPTNATSVSNNNVSFNATFSDNIGLTNATFYLWNSTNDLINTTTRALSGTAGSINLSVSLPYADTFKWNYLVVDEATNNAFNVTNWTLTYSSDTTAPTITINSPTGNLSVSQVTFNITTNENSETAQFSLNGGVTNVTMQNNGNTNFNHTNTSIADGTYTANFYVNDTTGNFNRSVSAIFTIDTIKPLVSYGTGTEANASILPGRNYIFVNVTATETNLRNITIRLYNSTTLLRENASASSTFSINYSGLSNGTYYFNATAYDTSGNINSTDERIVILGTNLTICGTLNSVGSIYKLISNLTEITGACFSITADNITINGNENLIDGDDSGTDYGVNATGVRNFTLNNIKITDFTSAVFISGSNKSTISNVNATSNTGIGFDMTGSWNNTLQHSIAFDNQNGVRFVSNGGYNKAVNVTANNNTQRGFDVETAYNEIWNSSANKNIIDGIILATASNNTFTNLVLNGSLQSGIRINDANSLNNNFTNVTSINSNRSGGANYDLRFIAAGNNYSYLIDSNIFIYGFAGVGGIVYFKDSSFGEVRFLTAINGSGTNLTDEVRILGNTIFINDSNYALNKSSNITFYGLSTTFTSPRINRNGNACADCSNFTSLNAGTVAINVSSGGNYSIVETPDTTPPAVTINLPANITYNSLPIRFNVTLNEDISYCNYTLNSGVKNYTMQNNGNRDFNATNGSIADGSYTAKYYCWDTSNNLNGTETRTFSIDTIAPTITINSPTGNLSVSQVTFNITTNENSETSQFSLNGGVTNVTMQNNGNTNFNHTNTSIADGTYTANFYVNDTAGNFNRSVSTIFTIDTIKPLVTINQPQTYVNSLPVLFNVTTNENVNYCNYTLNAGAKNYTMTANASNNGFNATNTSIADGAYTAKYYCWDTANNLNGTETKAFTIDTIKPLVTITAPLSNALINLSSASFNISINENATANYTLNSGATNYTMTANASNTGFNATNSSIADGSYTARFYVFDLAGNLNGTETRAFTIDTTQPVVSFISPTPNNGSTQTTTEFIVNVSSSDTNEHYVVNDFDRSLVGWYRMDDLNASGTTITDLSSYSSNGTISGAVQNSSGRFGKSYTFDGVNDYVSLGNPTSLQLTGSLTIAAWVYTNSSVVEEIVSKAYDTTINIPYQLRVKPNSNLGYLEFIRATSSGNGSVTSSGYFSMNTWAHVVVVSQDSGGTSSITFYIDGASAGSGSYIYGGSPITDSGRNAYIGASFLNDGAEGGTFNNSFNGSIDEVLIFNRALNLTEVKALYNASANQYYRNFSSLSQGSHNFTAYAVDSAGNKNQTQQRFVTIDNIAPVVTINSPTGNLSVSQVTFNITTNENSETAQFSLNGGVINVTMQNNGNRDFNYTNTSIADGTYTSNFYVNDTTGNFNRSVSRIFTIDTIIPGVTINQPSASVISLPVLFNVTTNENVNYCNYTLNSGVKNYTMQKNGNTNFNATNSSIADGSYTAKYYCWDTSNNLNGTETRTFSVDTISPSINVTSPENRTYTNNNITINFTSSDGNGINTRWWQNDTGNTTYSDVSYQIVSEGSHTWSFYSNDSNGNLNSTNITFAVDSIKPTIDYVSPSEASGANISRNYALVNVTSTDTNLANITIRLYNSTALLRENVSTSSPHFINYSGLSDGTYYFNASARDTFNNLNETSTRTFSTDTIAPTISFGTGTETDASALTTSNIVVNITSTDTNLANITIRLYNATALLRENVSTSSSYFINYSGLSDGTYYFNASARDTFNNLNETSTRSVTIENIYLSSCTTLDSVGTTYYVAQNIMQSDSAICLSITANNITLNGLGYVVNHTGNPQVAGIFASGVKNITIMNISVRRFYTPYSFSNVNNSVIRDSSSINSGGSSGVAVQLTGSNYNNQFINLELNGSISPLMSLAVLNSNFTNVTLKGSGSISALELTSGSTGNRFNNISILFSSPTGNLISIGGSSNTFTNVSANTHSTLADIFISAGINSTTLIDSDLHLYNISGVGGTLIVRNSVFGEVKFLRAVNGTGNLSSDIYIANTSAFINAGQGGLNSSANITFYTPARVYVGAYPLKLFRIGRSGSACSTNCYNFTALNVTSNLIFNVSFAGNYTIGKFVTSQSNISLDNSQGWNMFAITTQTNESGTEKNVTLSAGWNLIGYSSDNELLHSSLNYTNSSRSRRSFSSAVSSGKINNQLAYYDASAGIKRMKYAPKHDTSLRKHKAYWVYVNTSETLGANLTISGVGGSPTTETYLWRELMFSNGTSELNVTSALANLWIGQPGDPNTTIIYYYDTDLQTYDYIPLSATTLSPWRGYFIWTRVPNITLLRED